MLIEQVGDRRQQEPGGTGGLRRWRFMCSCATYAGESVSVTGDCDQLGNWKHNQGFMLEKVSPDYEISFNGFKDKTEGVWVGEIDLPADRRIKFRYFVCMVLDNPNLVRGNTTLHIVRRWESNPVPRFIEPMNCTPPTDPQSFGFINASMETMETGWLTAETLIQFKISNTPLRFWRKKHQTARVRQAHLFYR